ncbi:MAG TPA: adenylate/guanylate cyclase domain-containing protein [Burkholderiales bacterium]|jgi:hypothetical protein|nr:adenylate/guanylate cyclase domain-containing protein [Burkholderiales bacterium]
MMDRPSRTFISSVLFLDIVGYSKLPVSEQIRLKEQFNTLVSHLISDIPEADRIVLDTGDGAALSFLGDPEDALFVAVKLRDAIKEKQEAEFPDLHLRMGINLGPVKLLKDINGRPNLIGDGINVAQRVMNFAEPDQILVSRSFYDVVSCLSDEYRELFSDKGKHADKHVREHELYEIGFVDPERSVTITERMQVLEARTRVPDEQLAMLEQALEPHVGDHAHVLVQAKAMGAPDFATLRNALSAHIDDPAARAAFLQMGPGGPARTTQRKPWILPVALAGACVAILLAWWLTRPAPSTTEAAASAQSDAAASSAGSPAAPTTSSASVSAPVSATPPAPAASAAPKAAPPKAEPKKADNKAVKDVAKDAKAKGGPAPVPDTAAASAQAAAASAARDAQAAQAKARSGILRFQIGGFGEIYVDGNHVGSTSSISQYAVAPGEHRIEIRECGFPPDTKHQSVNVEANNTRLVVISC